MSEREKEKVRVGECVREYAIVCKRQRERHSRGEEAEAKITENKRFQEIDKMYAL